MAFASHNIRVVGQSKVCRRFTTPGGRAKFGCVEQLEEQIPKQKSSPSTRQPSLQIFQCFNNKCQCFLGVQTPQNVLREKIKTVTHHTNHVNSSTTYHRPVMSSRISVPLNYQSTRFNGGQSHISVVNNPLQNIEETIEMALKPPSKKPGITVASSRKLFKAQIGLRNIHKFRNWLEFLFFAGML